MKGKPEIALLLLGIAVATIFSESTAWSCDPIQWTTSSTRNCLLQAFFGAEVDY